MDEFINKILKYILY